MSMPYGAHETKIYYVEETSYGETPSNPTMLGIKAENIEPIMNPSLIKVRGVGSRDLQAIKKGLRDVEVKVAYPLPSDAPINFLQHIATLNSLSIEIFYEKPSEIIDLLFKGCRMNKAVVECGIEDVVKATVELVGQNVVVGNSKLSGATYADYAGVVPYYESFVQRGSGDGSGLATIERITDWKFTIENNLKQVPVIRSANGEILKFLPARHRNLTGELIFEFKSKQEYADIVNDSEFSLKFGLGGTNSTLFKYCKWESVSTPTKIEDLVSLKASFVARDVVIS